ncbi:MAG: hypothetical protein IJS03_05100 [Eubacterium sp.]|nr:hypothetical protein [Eubacterium sp.]
MPDYDNAYFLNSAGLALLLSKKEVSELYCLDYFGDDIVIDDESACQTLFSLVGDELVSVDGDDSFYLYDELEEITDTMVNADLIYALYSDKGGFASRLYYVNKDSAVLLQPDSRRKSVLKLIKLNSAEVCDDIYNSINIKKEITDDENRLFIESLELIDIGDSFEQIIINKRTNAFIDVFSPRAEKSVKKAGVLTSRNEQYLCTWSADGYMSQPYNRENLFEFLLQAVED